MSLDAQFEWVDDGERNPEGLVSVVVRMSRAEAEAMLAFDLLVATVPLVADCRPIARKVIAAVQDARTDGRFPSQP